jgi:hypothetical protein
VLNYILEKIDELHEKVHEIDVKVSKIHTEWKMVKKIIYLILAAIAAKLGIDLSNI